VKELKNRMIFSLIAILIVATLIIFSIQPITRFVLSILLASLAVGAMMEFIKIAKAKGIFLHLPLLSIAAIIQIGSFYLASSFSQLSYLPALIFFILVLTVFFFHFRKISDAIVNVGLSTFGLLYIALPLGMLFPILTHGANGDGRMWMAYLLITTKITDIGAYFGGKLFGKRKLAPNLSPNKTIEGLIIGVLFALASSTLFIFFAKDFFPFPYHLILLGILIAIIGQMGDLAESLLKRDALLKDSNRLPGLGGILDMLDSLFFTIPLVYFYLYL
jgi:phosphatidate cytidylyltransferase